jgi:hypothetical protein
VKSPIAAREDLALFRAGKLSRVIYKVTATTRNERRER